MLPQDADISDEFKIRMEMPPFRLTQTERIAQYLYTAWMMATPAQRRQLETLGLNISGIFSDQKDFCAEQAKAIIDRLTETSHEKMPISYVAEPRN